MINTGTMATGHLRNELVAVSLELANVYSVAEESADKLRLLASVLAMDGIELEGAHKASVSAMLAQIATQLTRRGSRAA